MYREKWRRCTLLVLPVCTIYRLTWICIQWPCYRTAAIEYDSAYFTLKLQPIPCSNYILFGVHDFLLLVHLQIYNFPFSWRQNRWRFNHVHARGSKYLDPWFSLTHKIVFFDPKFCIVMSSSTSLSTDLTFSLYIKKLTS